MLRLKLRRSFILKIFISNYLSLYSLIIYYLLFKIIFAIFKILASKKIILKIKKV